MDDIAIDVILHEIRRTVRLLERPDEHATDPTERASDAQWALGRLWGLADAARACGVDAARIDAAMGAYR